MMILPKFDYEAPDSISTVCSLLAQADGRAAVMAGGTDLVVQMKQRTRVPELVIGLKKLPELYGLSYSETEGLRISSLVTLDTLATSAVVKDNFPVLAEAASMVGATQHQYLGTIGGNLCLDTRCWYYNQSANWRRSLTPCHKLGGNTCYTIKGARKCYAVYSADVGSVLFALGSSIVVRGSKREKAVSIEEFFTGDSIRHINLQNDEVIKEIIVPPRKPGFARYYKLRRRGAIDFPQLGVTLVAFPNDNEYRIVINAVGARPLRFQDLELILREDKLTRSLVSDFADEVVSRIKPLANVYGSVDYRRKMAGLLIKKAFTEMGVVS